MSLLQNDLEHTQKMNVAVPKQLAELCDEVGAQFIHFSTDYVFDGTSPPYKPSDKTNPLQGYGISKMDAEMAVLISAPKTGPCLEIIQTIFLHNISFNNPETFPYMYFWIGLVLRVPVLYANDCEELDESATLIVAKDVISGKSKKIDNWGSRFPTHVDDVANLVVKILEKESPMSGIIHFSGDTEMVNTKYSLALLMGDILGLPTDHLQPDDEEPSGAPRPKNTALDCECLKELGIDTPRTPLKEGLSAALQNIITSR